jgi:hypothetical protein
MRTRAISKGIPFDLSVEYLASITPDVCPVFGTPFNFINNGKIAPDSPSVDRLRPELGYVEGNVCVVSMKANNIKSAYTAADVARVAEWMREEGL